MGNVKIYRSAGGMKLERYIALRGESQRGIRSAREVLHRYIAGKHAEHDQAGGSYITKSAGAVDVYVNLEDADGAAGAVWQEIFGTDTAAVFRPLSRRGRNFDWGKRFYRLKVKS